MRTINASEMCPRAVVEFLALVMRSARPTSFSLSLSLFSRAPFRSFFSSLFARDRVYIGTARRTKARHSLIPILKGSHLSLARE